MEHLNNMMHVNLSLNYLQFSMLIILVLLFGISFIKWVMKKQTGVFEVILVGIIPLVLCLSDFFAKSGLQHILK